MNVHRESNKRKSSKSNKKEPRSSVSAKKYKLNSGETVGQRQASLKKIKLKTNKTK